MAERKLGCPERTYQYLQRLRNQLTSAKVQFDRCREEAEEFRRREWFNEAEKMLKRSHSWMRLVRELEDEIGELEKLCFGK